MIKFRNAHYCNLKLFLLLLVVYGHLIEPEISQSGVIAEQYRWIYFIHMPLFSFLSGLFIRGVRDCKSQLIRIFPLYVLLQSIAVLFGNGNVHPLTPFWHLWYLLSCSVWLCIALAYFRFSTGRGAAIILIFSIAAGCLAGCVPIIGRTFSLSRTLVFLPYFGTGLLCNPAFPWKNYRVAGIASLLLACVLMAIWGKSIPCAFLYHADSYENPATGTFLRLLCYIISGSLGFFMLTFMPAGRFIFTKIGADTMPAYLIHAPIVSFLWKWHIPQPLQITAAFAVVYISYTLMRWHGKIFGITSGERRNDR